MKEKLKKSLEKKISKAREKIKDSPVSKGYKILDSKKKSVFVKIIAGIIAVSAIYFLATIWTNVEKKSKLEEEPEIKKEDITISVDKSLRPDTWLESAAKKVVANEKKIKELREDMLVGLKTIAEENKKMFQSILKEINEIKAKNYYAVQRKGETAKGEGKAAQRQKEETEEINFEKEIKKLYSSPEIVKNIVPQPQKISQPSGGGSAAGPQTGNVAASRKRKQVVNADLIYAMYKPTEEKTEEEKEREEEKKLKEEMLIPPGSFIKATLLSGVYAPTGLKAVSKPQPVLLKIRGKSFLPNKYRLNLNGCVAIGEAYGELASERAYIRVSKISCISKDKKVISINVKAYVVDTLDGKIGISGKVVSRKGLFLARSLMASFTQGIATAFRASLTSSSITPLGGIVNESVNSSDALRIGIGAGVAKAFEDLAKSYTDLAKSTFPVVEVPAGRNVDIVFLNMTTIKPIAKLK